MVGQSVYNATFVPCLFLIPFAFILCGSKLSVPTMKFSTSFQYVLAQVQCFCFSGRKYSQRVSPCSIRPVYCNLSSDEQPNLLCCVIKCSLIEGSALSFLGVGMCLLCPSILSSYNCAFFFPLSCILCHPHSLFFFTKISDLSP